jgi:hypothetical protein
MAKQNPNEDEQNQQGGPQSRPVGNYNPGGQAGKGVQGGGQRPADEPGGPFLGRSATSAKEQSDASSGNPSPGNSPPSSANPDQTGTRGEKGKQNAPQNQKL